jgi:hypothetical protein
VKGEYSGILESLYIQQNTSSDNTYTSSNVLLGANDHKYLTLFVRCLGSSFLLQFSLTMITLKIKRTL